MSFFDSDTKITVSLALLFAALSGCQSTQPHGANKLTSTALAGFWQCKTTHPAGQTTEHYVYLPQSGEYQSVGRVAFQVAPDKYLIYARASAGTWKLAGRRLIQRAYGSRGNPENADLRTKLKNDAQVAKALAAYQQTLNYGADGEDTIYEIDKLTATNLAIHTQLGTQRIARDCVKSSGNSVPAILREKPGKILALFKH